MKRFLAAQAIAIAASSLTWLIVGPLPHYGSFWLGVVIGLLVMVVKIDRVFGW